MTPRMTLVPHGAALPAAAIATLLLAGCSSGNIGESWQCPLAKGGLCDSVAAADPAVPDADAARKSILTEPLWRQRAGESAEPASAPCEAECGGVDPFAWLMRLLGGGEGNGRTVTQDAGPKTTAHIPPAATTGASAPDAAAFHPVPVKAVSRAREPEPDSLPAEPAPGASAPGGDDLRTGEVVARIWIAPFVDADGVYREASHVWAVLESARWRLGR